MENLNIVEQLKKTQKELDALIRLMGSAILSYQNNVDINNSLAQKNRDLALINDDLIKNNGELRVEGQKIIDEARKNADEILAIAKENLIFATKDRNQAKEEKENIMREVFLQKQKLEELNS